MNNADNGTLRGRLVGILIFVIIGLALWWAFLFFQNTDMAAYGFDSIPNNAGKITQLNKILETKKWELEELKKSSEAIKYDIANHIETKIEHPVWSDYINSLIEMYVQVKNIGKISTDSIELSDFVVDQQRIGLRGKVTNLNTIYQENGVIDRLTKLDFISNIQIPSYQKSDNVYEFQIQGEVQSSIKKKK
jgi:hypothetical protein